MPTTLRSFADAFSSIFSLSARKKPKHEPEDGPGPDGLMTGTSSQGVVASSTDNLHQQSQEPATSVSQQQGPSSGAAVPTSGTAALMVPSMHGTEGTKQQQQQQASSFAAQYDTVLQGLAKPNLKQAFAARQRQFGISMDGPSASQSQLQHAAPARQDQQQHLQGTQHDKVHAAAGYRALSAAAPQFNHNMYNAVDLRHSGGAATTSQPQPTGLQDNIKRQLLHQFEGNAATGAHAAATGWVSSQAPEFLQGTQQHNSQGSQAAISANGTHYAAAAGHRSGSALLGPQQAQQRLSGGLHGVPRPVRNAAGGPQFTTALQNAALPVVPRQHLSLNEYRLMVQADMQQQQAAAAQHHRQQQHTSSRQAHAQVVSASLRAYGYSPYASSLGSYGAASSAGQQRGFGAPSRTPGLQLLGASPLEAGQYTTTSAAAASSLPTPPPQMLDTSQAELEAQLKTREAEEAESKRKIKMQKLLEKLQLATSTTSAPPQPSAVAPSLPKLMQGLRQKEALQKQQVAQIHQQLGLRIQDIQQQAAKEAAAEKARAEAAARPAVPAAAAARPAARPAAKAAKPAAEEEDEIVILSSDDEEVVKQPVGKQLQQLQLEEVAGEEEVELGSEEYEEGEEGEEEGEEDELAVVAEYLNPATVPGVTKKELAVWDNIMQRPKEQIDLKIVEHARSSIPLTVRSLKTLEDGVWLNDEILNCSMALLLERDNAWRTQQRANIPRCHFFSTFFLNKLFKDAGKYEYKNVRRWTLPKKLAASGQLSSCVLECDRILVPVHVGTTHWACACIDLRNRRLQYYDSLRPTSDGNVLSHLAHWVVDEAADKLGGAHAPAAQAWAGAQSWPKQICNVPQQDNCCDCGMFALTFAAYASAGRSFDFRQEDIPTLRRRLMYDLVNLTWHEEEDEEDGAE